MSAARDCSSRSWSRRWQSGERERVEVLTRGLVNKLLHRVMAGLRHNESNSPDALNTADIARRLLCDTNGAIPDLKEIDDLEEDLIEDSADDDGDSL